MRIEYRDQRRRKIGRIDVDAQARPTRVAIESRSRSDAINSAATGPPLAESGGGGGESAGAAGAGAGGGGREVFLNWEGALDDSGQLRKCIACGCQDLFKEKAFPQVTGFVVVLAFVGAVVGIMGLATNLPVLLLLIVVLVLDVAILVFSRRRLVCYLCRSSYHGVPIARYHRAWDRAVADRYPAPARVEEPARSEALAGARSLSERGGPGARRDAPEPVSVSPDDDLSLEHKSYFA